MARRRGSRGDRVVRQLRPGAMLSDIANGTLPRSTDRDFEPHYYDAAYDAVDLKNQFRSATARRHWTANLRGPLYANGVPRVLAARRLRFPAPVFVVGARRRPPSRAAGSAHLAVTSLPFKFRFCVRRKQRKEVLFAKGVAGRRGVGAGKRWRRSSNSHYGC